MTSILVSQNEEDGSCFRIPRSASRTYDIKALPGTVLIISSLLVLTVYIEILLLRIIVIKEGIKD